MYLQHLNANVSLPTLAPNPPLATPTAASRPTKPSTWSLNGDGTIGVGVGLAVFFIIIITVGYTCWNMKEDKKKSARDGRIVDRTPIRDAEGHSSISGRSLEYRKVLMVKRDAAVGVKYDHWYRSGGFSNSDRTWINVCFMV
ncbi:hypothetical protein EG328_001539 [Venturia inaequalis]|uniref:Uncharacterized protein n=1 Tax=Venturia inaequalis TaxID=5025 RepID=A0A8H3VPP2_VENIN|nr:hypothetical protein EG328_001539 [Venturia inaequalis]KAE9991528.1 hypothetical protein EG327_011549 [Venturia inaequalis]